MRFLTITGFKVFILLAAVLTALPAGAQDNAARAVVERFNESLLAVMKDAKSLGFEGRYQRLKPTVEETFHLPLMIRIAAGSSWRKATPSQRAQLVAAFSRMSISTYASRFDGYSGEVFEVLGQRPGPQNTILVKTRIVSPDQTSARLTYVMKRIKGRWRAIDVLLDNNISELAVRRSEYRGVLRKGGLDGLIDSLNGKADKLAP